MKLAKDFKRAVAILLLSTIIALTIALQGCVPTTAMLEPIIDEVQMHEVEGYPIICFTHAGSIDCVVLEGR